MRKLEETPTIYDVNFTKLTKGINLQVQDWIVERIHSDEKVMDVGCGPGQLSRKLAQKGAFVLGIDKNPKMVRVANNNISSEIKNSLSFLKGSIIDDFTKPEQFDVIVSTFMLSELRPLEQQIFLREAWKLLKPNGRLYLAAEFVPSGFSKIKFILERWFYKKKTGKKSGKTLPLKWFSKYLGPIGYKIINEENWKQGSIKVLEIVKEELKKNSGPGYYTPPKKSFSGLSAIFRSMRCILTGQVDPVPIEPGIYQSGNPNSKSPILVTSNYDYTYIRFMKKIQKIDAWVLCVDSNGINVWCGARGDNFGNKQLIEAIKATNIEEKTQQRKIILPQLSAGGIAIPQLITDVPYFPFKLYYGPIWAKDIPEYLEKKYIVKPKSMKKINFSLFHRILAGITHLTFSYRKIFLKPTLLLCLGLIFFQMFDKMWFIGEFWLYIAITNILICIPYPIFNFTRKFMVKGATIGVINIIVLSIITYILHNSILFMLLNIFLYFWLAFFSTMSFSGYTFSTSPTEIRDEYPYFNKIQVILLIISIIFSSVGLYFL
nr:Acetyl-CoA decarbonylase/synthase complex subunit gamma [Candidatus Prometheoarchaeum syntrophicum]